MLKRIVINSISHPKGEKRNLVAVSHDDNELSICKQITVTNKHGSYLFDCAIGSFVPRGAIALTSHQRRKYRLKKDHNYDVEVYTYIRSCTMASLLDDKFNFKSKVGGAEYIFAQMSDF